MSGQRTLVRALCGARVGSRLAAVGCVLLAAATLGACGSTGPETGASTGASGDTSTTRPASPTPTRSETPAMTSSSPLVPSTDVTETGKAPATVTVTGTVSAGVEARCLVLTTDDGRTLQPLGGLVSEGETVTVEGHEATGVMTTCMQGTPFMVTKVVKRS